MEKEWRLFLKDNAPELYEQMQGSVSWAAEWRDKKITELAAEVDSWRQGDAVVRGKLVDRVKTLEATNQRLRDALERIKIECKTTHTWHLADTALNMEDL